MIKRYTEILYCQHCDKDTEHQCIDGGHERDSSGDYQTCSVCGWSLSGMSSEPIPPVEDRECVTDLKNFDRVQVLPQWAQTEFYRLAAELDTLKTRHQILQQAHAALVGKEWFTIPGPPESAKFPDDIYHLFFCDKEGTRKACTLFTGDLLLVGRKQDEQR